MIDFIVTCAVCLIFAIMCLYCPCIVSNWKKLQRLWPENRTFAFIFLIREDFCPWILIITNKESSVNVLCKNNSTPNHFSHPLLHKRPKDQGWDEVVGPSEKSIPLHRRCQRGTGESLHVSGSFLLSASSLTWDFHYRWCCTSGIFFDEETFGSPTWWLALRIRLDSSTKRKNSPLKWL